MYFIGLFIMTIRIALSVKSNLGVPPVSSIPYTMTCVGGKIEMGKGTILPPSGGEGALQITTGGTNMFRKMRRSKQQLSLEECQEILCQEKRGVLSVMGENGYPYGMPVNHWYCKENGKIYFHGAKEGHKVDAIRQNGKVSFCVYDQGYREEGQWALNIRSVIVFGTIRPVTEEEVCKKVCQGLAEKFTDDSEYAKKEWEAAGSRVLCLELTPDHITGKLVNES